MSSFTIDEINTLYTTDNVEMLKFGLKVLDEEIPSVQKIYTEAVKECEKLNDFRLSKAILSGTKAGLKDHGFSAGVGLVPLKQLRRSIIERLKSIPTVRKDVKEVIYGEPPVPSLEEADAEQDAIEDSMNAAADNNNTVLQEMILADKHQDKFEDLPEVGIHSLFRKIEKRAVIPKEVVDEFDRDMQNKKRVAEIDDKINKNMHEIVDLMSERMRLMIC
jgi:hypothetical protein